ncbi:MAR-binding filament-like protein isoform X1 [Tasmannia lanceolata]|uniref:MAR-binding filament-like protein isoform X1 n=1 Tax=Tasmannia lanceolata TaxID=3420 RepID=UPI0040636331
MSTVVSLCPPPPLRAARSSSSSVFFSRSRSHNYPQKFRGLVVASAASFDGHKRQSNDSKKSFLSNMIQEIEPLDVSVIQKDVPADTVDAMKRTISGMLGLLPSDQFHVLIEAFWEPLSKLLVSSMMTGYTLRNAEYRLCLERNLDIHDGHFDKKKTECPTNDGNEKRSIFKFSERNELFPERTEEDPPRENMDVHGLGEMTPEALEYIIHLQSCLSSAKNELREINRKNAALQMQHFVGEEKNDLLDYLRSLQPEKSFAPNHHDRFPWLSIHSHIFSYLALSCLVSYVLSKANDKFQGEYLNVAELSEPTSAELQETVHCVVHGLLATLSPKMHSKAPPQSDNAASGTLDVEMEASVELMDNTSLQFQPLISVTRDYLARLLFWCMLLGHYVRGLEYRVELMQLLALSGDVKFDRQDDEHAA